MQIACEDYERSCDPLLEEHYLDPLELMKDQGLDPCQLRSLNTGSCLEVVYQVKVLFSGHGFLYILCQLNGRHIE